MDLNKNFGTDKEKAEGGEWFPIAEGARIKVTKLGNPAFKVEVMRLQKPYTSLLRSTMDTSDIVEKITLEAMAKTILVDWEGISLDGETLDYSVDNAKMIMGKFPDFKDVVSEFSAERRNFLPVDLVEK